MKQSWSILALFAGVYLACGASIAAIEAGRWQAGVFEAVVIAALFPVSYLAFLYALHRASPASLRRGTSAVVASHAVAVLSASFVILYIAQQRWELPVQILLLPGLGLGIGWIIVLPLTIHAFVRSRAGLDFLPLLGYGIAFAAAGPVMLHIT